jgi:hypothetical protein
VSPPALDDEPSPNTSTPLSDFRELRGFRCRKASSSDPDCCQRPGRMGLVRPCCWRRTRLSCWPDQKLVRLRVWLITVLPQRRSGRDSMSSQPRSELDAPARRRSRSGPGAAR